ncbi:MAG: hypothetical protein IJV96_07735 [Clostridia bacterium]|nr:hypothetical protein [Clostridia bacterium]
MAEGQEKKGFIQKIKDFFKKLKEENRNLGTTMKRYNDAKHFCGNVNRGIKDGDFWNGSYISLEGGGCVIYGSAQDDYVFGAADVVSFEYVGTCDITVPATPREKETTGSSTVNKAGANYTVAFKDGKVAHVTFIIDQLDAVKLALNVEL